MGREEAIADFLQTHDMEEKLGQAFAAVAARNPAAVLIFWEDDAGFGAITVPYSRALAYGLAVRAYEMLAEETETQNDVDDSDTDSELG